MLVFFLVPARVCMLENGIREDTHGILYYYIQEYLTGGIRRGGLTPTLAPRVTVITEDISIDSSVAYPAENSTT